VFDAPEDEQGKSKVDVHADGGNCVVTITAGDGYAGRPLIFTMKGASDGCAATEDQNAEPGASGPPGKGPDPSTNPPGSSSGGANGGGKVDSGGCGCHLASRTSLGVGAVLSALVAAIVAVRRRRRH